MSIAATEMALLSSRPTEARPGATSCSPRTRHGPRSDSEELRRERNETEDEGGQGHDGDQNPSRSEALRFIHDGWMPRAEDRPEDAEQDQVVSAEEHPGRDQHDDDRHRNRPVGAARKGIEHVSAVELPDRKQVEERSEEHTSELQSPYDLVCRLLLE